MISSQASYERQDCPKPRSKLRPHKPQSCNMRFNVFQFRFGVDRTSGMEVMCQWSKVAVRTPAFSTCLRVTSCKDGTAPSRDTRNESASTHKVLEVHTIYKELS